jgi:hypothetical protein
MNSSHRKILLEYCLVGTETQTRMIDFGGPLSLERCSRGAEYISKNFAATVTIFSCHPLKRNRKCKSSEWLHFFGCLIIIMLDIPLLPTRLLLIWRLFSMNALIGWCLEWLKHFQVEVDEGECEASTYAAAWDLFAQILETALAMMSQTGGTIPLTIDNSNYQVQRMDGKRYWRILCQRILITRTWKALLMFFTANKFASFGQGEWQASLSPHIF